MTDWYKIVEHDGRKVDYLTHLALLEAEKKLGYELSITQGSYNSGVVGASAGTHDGGGVVDLRAWDWQNKVRALREVGFAAWYRPTIPGLWNEHIHAVLIGNRKLSPSAARQVTAYKNGRNGLANNGVDTFWRPKVIKAFVPPVAKVIAAEFAVLWAPLHGGSATQAEISKAFNLGADAIGFSEAYKHEGRIRIAAKGIKGKRHGYRVHSADTDKVDAKGRRIAWDNPLCVTEKYKMVESGSIFGSSEDTPLRYAPERWINWEITSVGRRGHFAARNVLTVTVHAHALLKDSESTRWGKTQALMERLENLVEEKKRKYGSKLAIVIMGDFNYAVSWEDRKWAPEQVFKRLGLQWLARGVDWIAFNDRVTPVAKVILSAKSVGQDHPWIRILFKLK